MSPFKPCCIVLENPAEAHGVTEIRSESVLVVTDPESDEASASAGILIERIAPDVFRITEHGISLLCSHLRVSGATGLGSPFEESGMAHVE